MNIILTYFLFILSTITVFSKQSEIVLKVGNVNPGNIDAKAFELLEETQLKIAGTAGYFNMKYENDHIFYGWIINSDTRQLVWHSLQDSSLKEGDGLLTFQTTLELEKGSYEIYYTGAPEKSNEINNIGDFIRQLGNSVSKVFKPAQKQYIDEYKNSLSIQLTASGTVLSEIDYNELIEKRRNNSLLSLTNIGNDERAQKAFSLQRSIKVYVYSVGELYKDDMHDYGWITNIDKNFRAWEMTKDNSLYAGGAIKNLMYNGFIELPPGNYTLNYMTDKTHAYSNWNSLPPYDPQFWGITLQAINDSDKSAFKTNKETIHKNEYVIAEITKVGNNEYLKKEFTLTDDTTSIRIIAIGEGDATEMYDYGWIVDEKTRIPVWEMEYIETTHAGGSKKNRIYNNVIKLPRGMYSVYFQTDDSNSYRKFLLSPPDDKENYGIRILREGN